MKSKFRYLLVLAISLGLAACGGSSNKNPVVVPPSPPAETIIDVAEANGNFTILLELLDTANLTGALDDEDSAYTVFAPTDAAFEALGEETLTALRATDPEDLAQVLLYHAIEARVDSTAAVALAGTTVEMANGQSVGLSLNGTSLLVNTSLVVTPDVPADNGIIHVIDAVLLQPAERGEPTANIVDTATANGNFNTLLAALTEAGLADTLAGEGNFTVFAPTDAAFAVLGEENIAALLADEDALDAVLLQHVLGTEVNSIAAYAANGTAVRTQSGADIDVAINFNSRALTYGGATVTTADIYTTNGIIHVIDTVVVGDVDLPAPPMSIVDVADAAGSFNTLLELLQDTGLNVTLDNLDETFTVFAPTDAAFAALPEGTLEALAATPGRLESVLLYHVLLDTRVLADAAITVANSENPFVTTAADGARAGLSTDEEGLLINLSRVTTPNVLADNGVIHVIDKVLLPPEVMGEPTMNIVETAQDAGIFTTLVDVLVQAGLDDDLADPEKNFTVFAPTDAAFAMIPEDVLAAIVGDIDVLTEILTQHVVDGDAAVDSVTAFTLNGTSVPTLSGNDITVEIVNGVLEVGGAAVTMFDIYTTNGIIHVIDSVIVGDVELPVPPMSIVDVAAGNPNFSTLAAALGAAELIDTLGDLGTDFTVFAPTNAAFDALLLELDATVEELLARDDLRDILLYHVISGQEILAEAAIAVAQGDVAERIVPMASEKSAGLSFNEALFINTSRVITPDVPADNGVIHAIDKVMLPPAEMGMPTMNIVDTAVANGNFETLAAALTAAELIDTLSDPDERFTVFAPTDAAFAMLPEGTVDNLLLPENQAALQGILLQHVVAGEVNSVAAFTLNGTTVPTASASGNLVGLEIVNGVLEVQGSAITMYDIYTTNGIIHVIDAVIVEAIAP